jgi:hypothetical protein
MRTFALPAAALLPVVCVEGCPSRRPGATGDVKPTRAAKAAPAAEFHVAAKEGGGYMYVGWQPMPPLGEP